SYLYQERIILGNKLILLIKQIAANLLQSGGKFVKNILSRNGEQSKPMDVKQMITVGSTSQGIQLYVVLTKISSRYQDITFSGALLEKVRWFVLVNSLKFLK